jgi:two-component system, cell cycle sensor histidine kinase and response regulator CckA
VDGSGGTGRVLLLEDVTDQRHDQAAHELAERNYRTMFENAAGGMFQWSQEGRFLSANRALARILGHETVEELTRSVTDLAAQVFADPKQYAELTHLIEVYELVRNFEARVKRGDGQPIWLSITARKLKDDSGKTLFFEGIAVEITERKEAEAEVRHLATFPRFNPQPVLEINAQGEVTYYNYAVRRLLESLKCRDVVDLLPENHRQIAAECIRRNRDAPDQIVRRGDHTFSWSFFSIVALDVVHVYGADLTAKLSLEAQLRQSQKMESIGQLAAGIAHDFNNLLTVIEGNAGLIAMDGSLPLSTAGLADEITGAAERAANLTRQLLTFSRRQPSQPRLLDLNDVLQNMIKMLTRLLGEDVALQFEPSSTEAPVYADPGMLEQVVLNLAVNARDAMPNGGRLTIGTRLCESVLDTLNPPPLEFDSGFVCLQIRDRGTGMPPEIVEHIFEPFFTTKDPGKGTGLGLATVYGIVKQHGGWIAVRSQPGDGSQFFVYLPHVRENEPEQDAAEQTPDQPGRGAETVLVVEDEDAVRTLVCRVLERFGYQVLSAENGAAAMEVWNANRDVIDLLLTDMVMPGGISGVDLINSALADRPDLKCVLSSGYSLALSKDEVPVPDGAHFLPKPYQPARLARMVRSVLDGEPVD